VLRNEKDGTRAFARTFLPKVSRLMALSALLLVACQTPNPSNMTMGPPPEVSMSAWGVKPLPKKSETAPLSDHLLWEGRVVIDVQSQPPTQLSGPFTLEMTPESGSLRLSGPLGSTAALLSWGTNWASIQSSQLKPKEQHFTSLSELTQHWLGSPIDLEELMPGLMGQENTHAGWLFGDNSGRVKMAQRHFPAPAVSIKLILDDPSTNP